MKRLLLLVLALALLSGVLLFYTWVNEPYRYIEDSVSALQTESEVLTRFGEPVDTYFAGETDYYVSGYSRREREISHKVHVFRLWEAGERTESMVLYVYIDEKGEIEDFYVGGS